MGHASSDAMDTDTAMEVDRKALLLMLSQGLDGGLRQVQKMVKRL
jgi:hypothetical protein